MSVLYNGHRLLIESILRITSSRHQSPTFSIDRRLLPHRCTEIGGDAMLSKAEEPVTGRTPVSHMSVDLRTPIVSNPSALLQRLAKDEGGAIKEKPMRVALVRNRLLDECDGFIEIAAGNRRL